MKNNQLQIITYDYYPEIPYEILAPAMRHLNGNALKLFIFLCAFNAGEAIPFSTKLFCEETGVSITGEKSAFSELLQAGYLILREKNLYEFVPQKLIDNG